MLGMVFEIVFNIYQHWTFPKHIYNRVVKFSVMVLDMGNSLSRNILLYHFCAIYAATYTTMTYLDQTYLVQITCEIQKLKFGSDHV